jgi:hypothetical protein
MNQPPLRTAHFLFDTNANSLNFLTPSKQKAVAISIQYKLSLSARSLFRNSFARRAASSHSSLAASHRISNRQSPRLERTATHRKQTPAPRPDRKFMHGLKNRISASPRFMPSTNHESQVTNHDSLITNHYSLLTNHANGPS